MQLPELTPAEKNLFLLGLGANLGKPKEQFLLALQEMTSAGVSVLELSPLVLSAPMGPQDQPDFVNACAWIGWQKGPDQLMDLCLETEKKLGRSRELKWGPRTLDLDLLWWSGGSWSGPNLLLPHPGLFERDFVLIPASHLQGFSEWVLEPADKADLHTAARHHKLLLEENWYP